MPQTSRRTDGRTDGRMDGRTDGRTDGQIPPVFYRTSSPPVPSEAAAQKEGLREKEKEMSQDVSNAVRSRLKAS